MIRSMRCTIVLILTAVLAGAASPQVGIQPVWTQEPSGAIRIHASSDVLSDSDGTLLWNASYGENGSQLITGAISLQGGGYAFIGEMVTSDTDLWLGVVDDDGALMWNKTYGGSKLDAGVDLLEIDDGFLLGGYTESYGAGHYDIWVLRTDSEGNLVDNITMGTPIQEMMHHMIPVRDGGYLILAQTADLSWADRNYTLIRLDSELNQLWNAPFDRSPNDLPFEVTELKDGGFAAVGWTQDAAGDEGAWVIKTGSVGNHVANYTFGVVDKEDAFYSVVEMQDESLSLFGHTDAFGAGGYDFWLLRIDSSRNAILNKTYGGTGGDIGDHIVRPRSGGLAFVGRTVSFGAGGVDSWLVRIDDDGNMLWNETYGGTANEYTRFVTEVDRGGFLVCGNSLSYGPGSAGGWLVLVPELHWVQEPSDMTANQNQSPICELNATSAADTTWSLNDTSRFSVNGSGVLTSVGILDPGIHGLNVTVTDDVGNVIWADFKVTIADAESTDHLPEILVFAAIAVVVVIVLGIWIVRKRGVSQAA